MGKNIVLWKIFRIELNRTIMPQMANYIVVKAPLKTADK